jgi:hypothetical protein
MASPIRTKAPVKSVQQPVQHVDEQVVEILGLVGEVLRRKALTADTLGQQGGH